MEKENDTNSGSNTTPIETIENVQVEGHDVTVHVMDKDNINIEAPEGLEGKELEEFEAKAAQSKSLIATLNKKGYLLNQKSTEQDDRSKQLDAREKRIAEKELKATQKETLSKIPSKRVLVMKHLGITDPADLEDVSRVDYLEAEDKAETEINQARGKVTDNSQLINDFISNGGDYNELLNLAQSLNAPVSKALINQLSKTSETKKPEFATTHLAKIQKKQIHIVKKGNLQVQASERSQRAGRIVNAVNVKKRL